MMPSSSNVFTIMVTNRGHLDLRVWVGGCRNSFKSEVFRLGHFSPALSFALSPYYIMTRNGQLAVQPVSRSVLTLFLLHGVALFEPRRWFAGLRLSILYLLFVCGRRDVRSGFL